MRLFIAALSFLIGLLALTGAFVALLPANAPEWLTGVGVLIAFSLSLFLTNKLVNAPGTDFWSLARASEPGEEPPEQEGLFVSTAYRATRCFQVEESGEEGSHYFIELHDGSVLHLNGRYLAALEPRKVLYMINRARKFPCTEFIVKRDRYDGCVVDIQCRGKALEPELVTPPFKKLDFQNGIVPQDGDILTSRTYDEIKAVRSRESGRQFGGWVERSETRR
jgi:hypothetical protein